MGENEIITDLSDIRLLICNLYDEHEVTDEAVKQLLFCIDSKMDKYRDKGAMKNEDLISRSEVNNVIDELEVYTCGRPNTMKVEVSVLQLQRFINKLKNIPTAYDINKVVAELERFPLGNLGCQELNEIIEIVKHGGVSDDVCEWKEVVGFDYMYIRNPHTNRLYSNEPSVKNIYCNTCGKKIRIVGD